MFLKVSRVNVTSMYECDSFRIDRYDGHMVDITLEGRKNETLRFDCDVLDFDVWVMNDKGDTVETLFRSK